MYASSNGTSSALKVYQFNQTNGDIVSKGTDTFNSALSITGGLDSSDTANILLKCSPASTSLIIYGADLTIATI